MRMNLFNDVKLMRHAFLILAHNEFQILRILLSMLDDERNDIYLHIDKKVVLGSLEQYLFRLAKARLFVLEQRLDVRWGPNFVNVSPKTHRRTVERFACAFP